jgi:hypothetical protein
MGRQSGAVLAGAVLVPAERIELPTFGLQNRCSTAELCRPTGLALGSNRPGRCLAALCLILGLPVNLCFVAVSVLGGGAVAAFGEPGGGHTANRAERWGCGPCVEAGRVDAPGGC